MKAILLLAGRSKRFWPLKEKSLFPICGKTLAEHQVECLKKGGCRDITLVTGSHNKKKLKKLFPTLPQVEQKDLDLGMMGACLSALPKMKKQPVLIVSGNDVIDPSAISDVIKAASKADGAILARKVKKYFPGGYLTVKGGHVRSIVEKPGEGKEPSSLVNIVAHVHNDPAALLAALKNVKKHTDDGYERALHQLFQEKNYRAVAYDGFWQPVKYPWHLLPILEHFLGGIEKATIDRTAKIHPTAVIEGNVILGKKVRVLPHASVIGPCFIGEGSVIGNNALVRNSSVGSGSVIGYNSEVKSSVLHSSVWTHITYLGDSVIGSNVSFGGGSVTGNLRLDEGEITSGEKIPTGLTKLGLMIGDNCRVGIRVGSNPGVKVGSESFISGGLFIAQDIPDGSFVLSKNGHVEIRRNTAKSPRVR